MLLIGVFNEMREFLNSFRSGFIAFVLFICLANLIKFNEYSEVHNFFHNGMVGILFYFKQPYHKYNLYMSMLVYVESHERFA